MPPTKEECDRALKALKKRLKLTRQDQEGSFSSKPLSGGRVSGIVGVRLPEGFPPEVWQELVAKNKIQRVAGEQTYALVPQAPQERH
jgi:hypothetical protein